MKSTRLTLMCIFCAVLDVYGTTAYVDRNGTNPIAPYSSWSTAATNIQDAIRYGSLILVTNGVYDTGSSNVPPGDACRAVVPAFVTLQSVNGPAVTIIKGTQVPGTTNGPGAVRGVFLSVGAVLSGFTVTNGATAIGHMAGGVFCDSGALITNCVIAGNCASSGPAGVYYGTLVNCMLLGNVSHGSPGGGAMECAMTNCIVFGNQGYDGAAGLDCKFESCTIVSNTGVMSSLNGCNARNSIIYYNYRTNGAPLSGGSHATNCCVFPAIPGANNFTNPPLFQNLAAGNLRLQASSPCIDAGDNSFLAATTDFEGKPRIAGLAVDLGAYEFGSIHYVSLSNDASAPPYMTWATAATNIQDAVDAAMDGEFVLVSNGVYQTGARAVYGVASNRVVIDKAVTVQSVNGTAATTILGFNPTPGGTAGIRCVYMTNGAVLSGFTLSNGAARVSGDVTNEQSGGGIWCESASAMISNCVFLKCYANQNGGAAYQGTLYNCTIATNVGFIAGGGAFAATLNNCTINSNRVVQGSGGGGVWGCTANNCLIVSNSAASGGGAYGGVLSNCMLSANHATTGAGGYSTVFVNCTIQSNSASSSGGGTQLGRLQNCVVIGNFAPSGGGLYSTVGANSLIVSNSATTGGGAYSPMLTNCTIVGNSATSAGGGVYADSGSLENSIIYYNSSADLFGAKINYCCSPGVKGDIFGITNPPLFVDMANGNFRLQTNSPCINSGGNIYAPTVPDLDGNPRVANYTVDIGAYESQAPGSIISYAFMQRYGFPIDGSADYVDSDGDGMSNWQEWRCLTDPTNRASFLAMRTPHSSGSSPQVSWTSVGALTYYLQRATDLTAPQPFFTIRSNIFGGFYTDTNATGPGPYFYRVGVQ